MDAAPIACIAQGLLTVVGVVPVFMGRGIAAPIRNGVGDYTLPFVLQGSPIADINSGPVAMVAGGWGLPDGIPRPNGVDPLFTRVEMTVRGNAALPPTTRIASKDVSYVPGLPGQGVVALRVVFTSQAGGQVDPNGANAGGVEIIVWASELDRATQQLVGPNYQSVMQFP